MTAFSTLPKELGPTEPVIGGETQPATPEPGANPENVARLHQQIGALGADRVFRIILQKSESFLSGQVDNDPIDTGVANDITNSVDLMMETIVELSKDPTNSDADLSQAVEDSWADLWGARIQSAGQTEQLWEGFRRFRVIDGIAAGILIKPEEKRESLISTANINIKGLFRALANISPEMSAAVKARIDDVSPEKIQLIATLESIARTLNNYSFQTDTNTEKFIFNQIEQSMKELKDRKDFLKDTLIEMAEEVILREIRIGEWKKR